MSEHRRKPAQSPDGGRAAVRRGAQQQPPPAGGRRAAGFPSGAAAASEPPYQGRAAARRAAQGGGRRRDQSEAGTSATGPGRGGYRAAGRPPKKRFIDYPRWGKTGWRRWTPSWKQVTSVIVAFLGVMVGTAWAAYATVRIPDMNVAAKAENNVYYWDNGDRMVATGGSVNRQMVTIDKIPLAMQNAVISAENKTFRKDSGVDPQGIARAVWNMAKGGQTQGGSTITQQYVKNAQLGDQSQTITRKVKELFIAFKVGEQVSKDKVLAGYLNTSYYGRGAYGIQAAAQTYYGKNSENLTASQCAFLAALLKGATYYDPAGAANVDPVGATPAKNRQRSQDRWKWILNEEHKDGHLTDADWATATKKYPEPDGLKATAGMSGQISYLVGTAKDYVLKHSDITRAKLDRGGYEIHTTFNKKRVEALANAVKDVKSKNIDEKKRPKTDTHVQFGAASVVPGDGKIVAIYGGAGYENGQFNNNADTHGVPVGSTWKPFVLAAAMQYGTNRSDGQGISPDSKYNGDDELKIRDHNGNYVTTEDGSIFKQKNESDHHWGYITLNKAMEQSINTPFVQLGEDVGLDKVKQMAGNAGIPKGSFESLNASFSIGTSTPGAISMADAYGTFAASGTQADPYCVTKVLLGGQKVDGFDRPEPKEGMRSDVADTVTKVLQNVVQKGTGTNAKAIGRPAAGKTGTTDSEGGTRSAWFVGYTPQLSTSVMMFREDPKHPGLQGMAGTAGVPSVHGGEIPTRIWAEYMTAALDGQPQKDFPNPPKIGEIADGAGAPTAAPKPTVTESATPPQTTSPAPSPSAQSSSAKPKPSKSCGLWDPTCAGGAGGAGGSTSSPTASTSPSASSTGGNGNGSGNPNGGIFG